MDIPNMTRCEGAVLQFSAPCATIAVSRYTWGTFAECDVVKSRCHAIIIRESCAGLVIFNSNDDIVPELDLEGRTMQEAWELSAEHVEEYEAVAIASDCWPWGPYFPITSDPNNEATFGPINDSGVHDGSHALCDVEKWEETGHGFIKIMVIERKGALALRRGVGQIHPDAWEATRYALKEINLG